MVERASRTACVGTFWIRDPCLISLTMVCLTGTVSVDLLPDSMVLMRSRFRSLKQRAARQFLLRLIILIAVLMPSSLLAAPAIRPAAATEQFDVQAYLDRQSGMLKTYQDGSTTAAQAIQGFGSYYSLDPRVMLALLELENKLVSSPHPSAEQPQSPVWRTWTGRLQRSN